MGGTAGAKMSREQVDAVILSLHSLQARIGEAVRLHRLPTHAPHIEPDDPDQPLCLMFALTSYKKLSERVAPLWNMDSSMYWVRSMKAQRVLQEMRAVDLSLWSQGMQELHRALPK